MNIFDFKISNKAPVGDLLATIISGGRREVSGGRTEVPDWSSTGCRSRRKVVRTIWSQRGFACCKWNFYATKSIE